MVLGGKTSIVLKLYSYFSKEKEGSVVRQKLVFSFLCRDDVDIVRLMYEIL